MIVQIGKYFFDCFEAETPEEQAIGLSKQPNPAAMLFIYDEEESHQFWMPPQMRFPVDIVFIEASGKINAIHEYCQPGEVDEQTGLPVQFEGIGKWVLEIPAGIASACGIRVGNPVHFDDDEEEGLV